MMKVTIVVQPGTEGSAVVAAVLLQESSLLSLRFTKSECFMARQCG